MAGENRLFRLDRKNDRPSRACDTKHQHFLTTKNTKSSTVCSIIIRANFDVSRAIMKRNYDPFDSMRVFGPKN
jgi:hypothetical protein